MKTLLDLMYECDFTAEDIVYEAVNDSVIREVRILFTGIIINTPDHILSSLWYRDATS